MSEVNVQFYTKTSDAWEAMLADLEKATKTIDLEQYIFTIDSIGRRFIEVLERKSREGVVVRMLCDTVGSWNFYRSLVPDLLNHLGIRIRFFNPISPWRITNFTSNFFRDHRKLLIIDNQIGHIGGVGIQADMADWRDTHMRVIGPLAEEMTVSFEALWSSVDKPHLARFKKVVQFVKQFNLQVNYPRFRQRYIYQALIANIRSAKKYVYLTTPYFIPDIRLYRVLRLAAKKGVDVRLIVPDIADHVFVNHARESYFTLALKSGIKIYRYKDVMMHAKTAVVDDTWGTAGSFNLDSLSFYFNHEINISSSDLTFIHTIKRHFHEDLLMCEEVTHDRWVKRSFRKKFLELLTWPFHSIM
ncbi:MAG: phospholipase D-like domain-containing protein [Patescibacteria group bacterium]